MLFRRALFCRQVEMQCLSPVVGDQRCLFPAQGGLVLLDMVLVGQMAACRILPQALVRAGAFVGEVQESRRGKQQDAGDKAEGAG